MVFFWRFRRPWRTNLLSPYDFLIFFKHYKYCNTQAKIIYFDLHPHPDLYLTFMFDIYIWHLYLTITFDIYIWHLSLTFISDISIWHLCLACGSIHFPRLFSNSRAKCIEYISHDCFQQSSEICIEVNSSRICVKKNRQVTFFVFNFKKLQQEHPDTHRTGGFRRRQ